MWFIVCNAYCSGENDISTHFSLKSSRIVCVIYLWILNLVKCSNENSFNDLELLSTLCYTEVNSRMWCRAKNSRDFQPKPSFFLRSVRGHFTFSVKEEKKNGRKTEAETERLLLSNVFLKYLSSINKMLQRRGEVRAKDKTKSCIIDLSASDGLANNSWK